MGNIVDGRLVTSFGVTLAVKKPWRVDSPRAPGEGAFVLRFGGARLHVFEGALDDADWIRRWQAAVPTRSPLPVEANAMSITHEPLDHELTLTSVSTPKWTPVFLWVRSSRDAWHLRMDSELQRAPADKRALIELVHSISR